MGRRPGRPSACAGNPSFHQENSRCRIPPPHLDGVPKIPGTLPQRGQVPRPSWHHHRSPAPRRNPRYRQCRPRLRRPCRGLTPHYCKVQENPLVVSMRANGMDNNQKTPGVRPGSFNSSLSLRPSLSVFVGAGFKPALTLRGFHPHPSPFPQGRRRIKRHQELDQGV